MKIVVIGVGNVLMGDDGFGVAVVEELRRLNLPVEIYDCSTLGLQILNYVEGCDLCIVVDTVKANGKPGELYIFDLEECKAKMPTSLHDIGLVEAFKLGGFAYKLPKKVIVVGVEPERVEFGLELSKPVRDAIPKAVKMVVDIINKADEILTPR